jgi:4-hydroxybenzoate polyprenyltransferase
MAVISPPMKSGPRLLDYWSLLRPRQWTKNLFVFPAALFGLAHVGVSGLEVARLLLAFVGFCLISSFVYVLNDILDVRSDGLHPKKRHRPIANGRVSRGAAFALASGLFALAIVAGFSVGHDFTWTLFGYVLNSFLYLLLLKERVIADVLAIALGFMLRIFGGAAAAGVEPTSWLAVCGFSLALFLGFCKRRSEINCYESEEVAAEVRVVFRSYTKAKLDVLVGVMAAVTIVTYMMFTVSPDTVRLHGTTSLIYTSPFVVYCVLRFLMKSLEQKGEDAAETLFMDSGFLAAGVGWAIAVVWILSHAT